MSVPDPDYRARFWPSGQGATMQTQQALEHVDAAIGNLEGCRVTVGKTDPDVAAPTLLEHGVEVIVVKQGMMGTLMRIVTEWAYVSVASIRARDGLGASDGLSGTVYHGPLQGWDLARTFAFVSATGVIAASRLEYSTAMPRINEVERLMAVNPQTVPVVNRIRC